LASYDVTDKTNSTVLSKTSYQGASYVHQGWLLDPEWHKYLISDDEYDEYNKAGLAADGHPVTYIWDISNLEAPKQTGYYKSSAYGIDHNQYVHDGFAYQSNYGSGFRILDVRSIPQDPTGQGVEEVAFFDVYPEDDALPNGGIIDFVGTWSSYAYFKSGYIFVNTMERGGFVLKRQ
jgi:choice-of-anchor B domain-containing protein